MGEVIRDKYRGRGVGFVQTGAAFGPGLAALVYAGLYAILPEAIAWRALFAVGILPALLVLWIRRSIPESEAFQGRNESGARPGIAQLFSAFRGPYLWLTVKVALMVMGAQGGVWAVGFWMVTYLRTERHLTATGTGQGFCYNAGRAFGSVFMTAIGFATAVMPLGTAIALFSTLAHGLMIVMLLLLPETRGRAIANLEDEAPGAAPYPSKAAVGRG